MIGSDWKRTISLNAKNLVGWRTERKIIVFSVDDYGNVRLNSKEARDKLDAQNIPAQSSSAGFDLYDTLETTIDLELLFEVLSSVKDVNGRNAVFTAFAVPCNPDFEKMRASGYQNYQYELLPDTFNKLSESQPDAYSGAWQLWQQGIRDNLLIPQFHGREHHNINVLEHKLSQRETNLLAILNMRSAARISPDSHRTRATSAAFGFWDFKENNRFKDIIIDGLNAFESVFGYRATHFMAPGQPEHSVLHKTLRDNGIAYIDTPMVKKEHQGRGKYKWGFNYTGKQNDFGQTFMVRNVVFEPTNNRNISWVDYTMKQIEAAFRWNRPAIVSSHRVNFCGHIDPKNRESGLAALRELLKKITTRWPEVEFLSANELGQLVESE